MVKITSIIWPCWYRTTLENVQLASFNKATEQHNSLPTGIQTQDLWAEFDEPSELSQTDSTTFKSFFHIKKLEKVILKKWSYFEASVFQTNYCLGLTLKSKYFDIFF